MNDSKKLLYVWIVVALVVLFFIGLFIFLIIKIDVVGHLFNNKNYIRTASSSNLDRYLDDLDGREFEEKKREKKAIEEKKKEKKEEIVDKSILKFVDAIRNKRGISLNDEDHIVRPYKNVGASYASPNEKQKEIEKEVKKIQSFYDKGYYPKSSWLLIDTDLDGYGFNYYFNDNGN